MRCYHQHLCFVGSRRLIIAYHTQIETCPNLHNRVKVLQNVEYAMNFMPLPMGCVLCAVVAAVENQILRVSSGLSVVRVVRCPKTAAFWMIRMVVLLYVVCAIAPSVMQKVVVFSDGPISVFSLANGAGLGVLRSKRLPLLLQNEAAMHFVLSVTCSCGYKHVLCCCGRSGTFPLLTLLAHCCEFLFAWIRLCKFANTVVYKSG